MQTAIATATVPVTAENFNRAESDLYFGNFVKAGGVGKFSHRREPAAIDKQDVIRMNRDTLYSSAILDLDAGPATITMPDAGKRFMSMQVIDQDQYTYGVFYAPTKQTLTREGVGTRYVACAVRTLIDPTDPKDIAAVHALQDALEIDQATPGKFEVPQWDKASQDRIRAALLVLGETLPDSRRTFGKRGEVDPLRFLIGSAVGWGGNPEKEATYIMGAPEKNDGKTVHRFTVKDVPVDGFWSISVYNAQGYFEKNDRNAYSVNNLTAKKDPDGSVTVQFGGCNDSAPNCVPIMAGWNYAVRLYRPRKEILDGTWKFPVAQPVGER